MNYRFSALLFCSIICFCGITQAMDWEAKHESSADVVKDVSSSLLNKFDPIDYVLKMAQNKKVIINGQKVSVKKVIACLLASGVDIVRIPNYLKLFVNNIGSISDVMKYEGKSPEVIPIPEEINLTALDTKGFLSKPDIDFESMGDFAVFPQELIEILSSFLDLRSFINLKSVNQSLRHFLLNSKEYIPPAAINRHLLNLKTWHLIEAFRVWKAEELVKMVAVLSCKHPNHGIAIDFEGYTGSIDKDLIDQLKYFPIVSLNFIGNNFPEGVNVLQPFCRLRELLIRNCSVKVFPAELCTFKELLALDLSHNEIGAIPDEVCKLSELRFVNLRDNRIAQFNASLCALPHIRMLILANNCLSALPSQISALKQLRLLDIGNSLLFDNKNIIMKLPDSLGALERLKILFCDRSGLTALPSTIGALKKLKRLYADNDALTQLPSQIGELERLQSLSLAYNQLKTLPPNLKNCTSLEVLNCCCNDLEPSAQEVMLTIPNLKRVYVIGNGRLGISEWEKKGLSLSTSGSYKI